MAEGDRYIDCTNNRNESIESLKKRVIRIDGDGLPYVNFWASGLDPSGLLPCDQEWTLDSIFLSLLVEDADGDLAIASFGT